MKPKLQLMSECPGVSSWAMAAKNIKEELRCAFPGIKFSVRSESFSMGDAVRIGWDNGPTAKEVDALVRDYCDSEFDDMQDLSTHVTKAKHVYGSAKYVTTSRHITEFIEQIEAALKPHYKEEDHHQIFRNQNLAYRVACKVSMKAGQQFKAIHRKTDTKAAGCFSEFWEVELTGTAPELPKLEPGQIIKTKHTQKGFDLFVAQLPQRVSREAFSGFLSEAKQLGGWYSSYAVGGAVPGFQFKTELSATAFLHVLDGKPSLESAQVKDQAEKLQLKGQAERLRSLADGMESQIDSKINSGTSQQNPTPRRIRIANQMRADGEFLQRVQLALRKIADAMDSGVELPFWFATTKFSKSLVHEALCGRGEPALVQWLKTEAPKVEEDPKAKRIREIEQGLVGSNIPGFFPTPLELVQRMLAHLPERDNMLVLEPSAGSGAIACAVNHGSIVHCCERNYTLAELLKLKGQRVVSADFLDYEPGPIYDAAVMNPPFEQKQAISHINRAWDCLKPGGRLIAIAPESIMFNSDADYADFRAWLETIGAEIEDIEAGAFERSGTGVKTRMVIATK